MRNPSQLRLCESKICQFFRIEGSVPFPLPQRKYRVQRLRPRERQKKSKPTTFLPWIKLGKQAPRSPRVSQKRAGRATKEGGSTTLQVCLRFLAAHYSFWTKSEWSGEPKSFSETHPFPLRLHRPLSDHHREQVAAAPQGPSSILLGSCEKAPASP
jgi:hypothetical protein